MVKVSFNAALAQKDAKKDAETLIPEDDEKDAEAGVALRAPSRAWGWCMCLGLVLMLSGLVVGGVYLWNYYREEGRVFVCGFEYREEDYMVPDEQDVVANLPSRYQMKRLEESVRVLEREQVTLINVPVPEFLDNDPADIVHDFQRKLTAYLDLNLNKCYVIPLNTSVVMPPRDFLELVENIKLGSYLPQSYLLHEDMVVTERLHHIEQLGPFIYNLCVNKATYKLQHREHTPGIQKREAAACFKILHSESQRVVETRICEF